MPPLPTDSARAPILLANADFYGTLAATRAYGEHGIPVTIADPRILAPARWSQHTSRFVHAPAIATGARFVEWLLDFGARNPGHVLHPTSDEFTFLVALHREELSRVFHLDQPDVGTALRVLDKKRLYAHAAEAGVLVPPTWFPESDADIERALREADGPLLIKPRSQVLHHSKSKGRVVPEPDQLVAAYRKFARENTYGAPLRALVPDIDQPMLQRYYPEAAEAIYSIAGYVGPGGDQFAALAAYKVLQRPRNLGIGLCFEAATLDAELADGIRRTCVAMGYHGMFQVEMIRVEGRHMLIDFNPRFYNQLALDVARGLPLPLIAYHAALGDRAEVERLLASVPPGDDKRVFCSRFGLEVLLVAQRVSGRMSSVEVERWRAWYRDNESEVVDATASKGDMLPAVVDALGLLYAYARHPRYFFRSIVLNR